MKNDIRKQNAVVPAIARGLCYELGCHGIFVFAERGISWIYVHHVVKNIKSI